MEDLKKQIDQLKNEIEENKSEKEVFLKIVEILNLFQKQMSDSNFKIENGSRKIIDYLSQRNFSQHSDIILDIAYYLEHFKGVKCFSVDDIRLMYEDARRTPPKNINDYLGKLERDRSLLIECKERKDRRKTWKLSAKGLFYIESFEDKSN